MIVKTPPEREAPFCAKKSDTEIKSYYERKVAEGKNKMSVINAIRCKIISRAFSVIKRETPFVNIQNLKQLLTKKTTILFVIYHRMR